MAKQFPSLPFTCGIGDKWENIKHVAIRLTGKLWGGAPAGISHGFPHKDCLLWSQARDGVAWGGTRFRPGEFFLFGSTVAKVSGTKLLSVQMGSVHRRLLLILKNIPKVIQCNPSLHCDICLSRPTIPLTPVNHPTGTETLPRSSDCCF